MGLKRVCAAKGCRDWRVDGSMFCALHPFSINRNFGRAGEEVPEDLFDSAEPGGDWSLAAVPRFEKLRVKFNPVARLFYATQANTNVVGYGISPGAAIRDWKVWWEIPY